MSRSSACRRVGYALAVGQLPDCLDTTKARHGKPNLPMVIAYTTTPKKLLNSIKTAVDERLIRTWSYDADDHFTHTPPQWEDKAFLRPKVVAGERLEMRISFAANSSNTTELYAVYHGRFIEMLLAHFDHLFSSASASAQPVKS